VALSEQVICGCFCRAKTKLREFCNEEGDVIVKRRGSKVRISRVYIFVMQRFVNLKVGSVFGILHPETAISILVFNFQNKKKNIYFLETETAVSG